MPGWMTHKLQSRLSDYQPPQICRNGRKWKETEEPLDEGERGEWKSWLKTQHSNNFKIMASNPITSWQIDGGNVETVSDFIFLVSKITADGDCSHKIKRHLLLGRISMTNLLLRQSCLTLCDPIDSSPPGSSITGILQARTLEWVAISFSSAWKWTVKVKPFSCVRLCAILWMAAYQAPPTMGFSRQEYWSGSPLPSPMTNLDSILKSRDITLPTKVYIVKAVFFSQ